MTRTEHLLTQLAEECNEVAQRCSKALRFGTEEIYREHPDKADLTNAERIAMELDDLVAVASMLEKAGVLRFRSIGRMDQKISKVERFLRYSRECGTLHDDGLPLPGTHPEPVLCEYECERCGQRADHYTAPQAASDLYERGASIVPCGHKMKLIGPA